MNLNTRCIGVIVRCGSNTRGRACFCLEGAASAKLTSTFFLT
jgi:hypothetical protein